MQKFCFVSGQHRRVSAVTLTNLWCGSVWELRILVDARGQHGLVWKQAPSRIARYQQLNDLVTRALVSAGMPGRYEPVGLTRQDGKRPNGVIQMPWRSGKLLVWDVSVVSTLADSYVATAARGHGEVVANSLLPEIRWHPFSVHFPSNCHGDLGLNEPLGIPFLRRPWPQD